MALIELRKAAEDARACGSNIGALHSASCVGYFTCNSDAMARSRIARSDSHGTQFALDTVTSMNERRFQQLPTSGAPMAAAEAPSISGNTAKRKLGPVVTNVKFHNFAQEIALEPVQMRELLLDLIIQPLVFRARTEFKLFMVKFRKI
jgi:hypothetical protein